MRWAEISLAIVPVVEVPVFAGSNQLSASGAGRISGLDGRPKMLANLLMAGAVPPLSRLLLHDDPPDL
jgi:hypothetical protein